MPKGGGHQTKALMGFLFHPEDSSATRQFKEGKPCFLDSGMKAEYQFREVLKSALWVFLSVLIAVAIAQLK